MFALTVVVAVVVIAVMFVQNRRLQRALNEANAYIEQREQDWIEFHAQELDAQALESFHHGFRTAAALSAGIVKDTPAGQLVEKLRAIYSWSVKEYGRTDIKPEVIPEFTSRKQIQAPKKEQQEDKPEWA